MIRAAITTIALIITLAWLGPTLDDHSTEQAQADDLQSAQQQADAQHRYQATVQRLCGANAAYLELDDGVIQCKTKRGHPTRRVTLITTAQVLP